MTREHSIVSLQEDRVDELGTFLRSGLEATPDAAFADPDVLRWKYLEPNEGGGGPRSLIMCEQGRITAHIGVCHTEFVVAGGSSRRVPTLHVIDWLASGTKSFQGLTLLLRTCRMAETQYVFGCTSVAERVLLGAGYRVRTSVPLFQKALRSAAWDHIHAGQPLPKKLLLLMMDRAQSVLRRGIPAATSVEFRRVEQFGSEVDAVLSACPMKRIYTSRGPQLLNHFLRYPRRTFSGWLITRGDRTCGFGLLNVVSRGAMRVGKVVECFLNDTNEELWQAAVHALSEELGEQGADLAICYGSTPWMASALRRNGFFRRGRTTFLLRDPKNLIPSDRQLHLTHLEADISIL